MAKSFYSADEAAQKIGKSPDELTELVKAGKLREFRDGDEVKYKAEDIDKLAPEEAGGSASDAIVLEETGDESSIVLAATGSDVLSLEEIESDDTSAKTAAGEPDKEEKKKGDSVVSSVGVSVFDDDELDDVVDPLAQTAISDVAGLGIEGVGSGSGILDLTRESDDTSLGAELLDEIYAADDKPTEEMGEDTRAGIDQALTEGSTADEAEEIFEATPQAEAGAPAREPVAVVARYEYAPDALSSGLTALMVVATIVLAFGGLAAVAMVRGVVPGIVEAVYNNLMWFSGGALIVGIIAALITFMVARRS
jgi:hypothetical protein